jgi:energy-coupling factor transporter ATP-binding protein EcfA2
MLREIAGKQYLYPQVKDIALKSVELKKEGKAILIVGQPGSGKSVFMSQLHDELKDRVEYLTAIRAESLGETDSPKGVYAIFERVENENKPKVLLLDSLDVLAYSRRRELQEWLFCVDKLKNLKGTTVVCASRDFEAEHLYPMNEQAWSEKTPIEVLPDEFIGKVFSSLDYDYSSVSSEFREFLRVPLHLRVTADIVQNGGDPKDICALQGLYAKLCELLNISANEMGWLTDLAEQMIKNKTIHLSYPAVSVQLLNDINEMQSRPGITGIIRIDSRNQRLSFSHQTLIDYFSAWKVTNENKSMKEFVLEHDQSLFIRPVLRHIIGFLRSTSAERLFKELRRLFFEKRIDKTIGFVQRNDTIRMHIKTAILSNIASWDNPTPEEGKFLMRLFRETKEEQRFVTQFFNSKVTSDWYPVLREIYILPTLRDRDDSDVEYRAILSFLAEIAKGSPSEIFDVSSLLLNQQCNSSIEWFFHRASDELSVSELADDLREKYVELFDQVVRKDFIKWYYEVMIICNRIARYSPEKGLRLFVDSVLRELQDKDTKINSYEGSLAASFDEVLPSIYEKIPCQVLLTITEFLEEILSAEYSNERKLWDWPANLLYSRHARAFVGLDALYEWYKTKALEFCSDLTDQAKQIIERLRQSKWKSQRQLSMLCKLRNASNFKGDIVSFIQDLLRSNLDDSEAYEQSELFIRAVEQLGLVSSWKRQEIIRKISDLKFDDESLVRTWIWKPLHHIPEPLRNANVKKRLEEIRDNYNFEKEYRYGPPIITSSVQAAQSPISADVLRAKTPDELCKFLIENRDSKDRLSIEENRCYGGVREVAREVATVFVEDLSKYRNVIEKLSEDSVNDEYLKWFFVELWKGGIAGDKMDWLIDLISDLHKREKLQLEIVRVLRKVADDISNGQFNRLKDILLSLSRAKDPEKDRFFESRKQGYSNDALSEGINSTRGELADLTVALLSRFREDYLSDVLERLSKDKTISVRAALVRCLPYAIKPLGWSKCLELFSNAFEKGAEEYSNTISSFLQYTPNDKLGELEQVLNKMREKRSSELGESYATLATIFYLRGIWSAEDLTKLLRDKQLIDKGKKESFRLLAGHVKFESSVDRCLRIIDAFLGEEKLLSREVSVLFMQARPEDLGKFVAVIERVIGDPEIRERPLYHILQYLERSLLTEPLTVFGLLEKILSQQQKDLHGLRNFIPASHSKAPLNIINTMLECYPEEENRALKALDKLIELNWEGVNEYLSALDRL